MPPVMTERKPINEILSDDNLLDGYEHCNIVFTDIGEDLLPNVSTTRALKLLSGKGVVACGVKCLDTFRTVTELFRGLKPSDDSS